MFDIFNEDAIILMNRMIEDKVLLDHIITDPPYNIARKNNFETMGRSSIDFGEWDKDFDQLSWIKYAYKLIKKGGSLIIFNDWKNIGEIAKYAEMVGFEIKDPIRWVKDNPIPRNRDRRYITDYEMAVWLVKPGAKWTFNRLNETYDRPEYKYPVVAGHEKTGHPTQKSLELMKEILIRHTNEGELIGDFFMGSGTTGKACIVTDRDFIGSEINKEFFNIAEKTLNKTDIL